MQLSSINFSALAKIEYPSKQVARLTAETGEIPREVFRSKERYYKVWKRTSTDHRTVFWDGHRRRVRNVDEHGEQVLLGFLYGLYDEIICPAFVENIYDGRDLIGYVTRPGEVLKEISTADPMHAAFLRRLKARTLESGCAYRDLKPRNIVQLSDGRLSLIDLEPPPVLLNHFSAEQETRHGSLARFTSPTYRKFLKALLDPQNSDPRLAAARRRFAARVPDRFMLSVDDFAPNKKSRQMKRPAAGPISQKSDPQ